MADEQLRVLHDGIEARVRDIQDRAGSWPCRKGCDRCCRRLANLPQLTRVELNLLNEAVAKLPAAIRDDIDRRIAELPAAAPYICPLLDRDSGACLIYDNRPIACRTYGFYVERDKGLYCNIIEAALDRGEYQDVIWGNAESVDARLAGFGEQSSWPDR